MQQIMIRMYTAGHMAVDSEREAFDLASTGYNKETIA